jgi:signal transduction histidine kinase
LKFSKPEASTEITITSRLLSEEEIREHDGLQPETRHVLITVKDNGIGFKQEHAQQIFNIFQRLHVKTEYSGTGIGLALCKKIVQNHRGEIWAESSNGNGASFYIILPEKQLKDVEA